MPPLPNKSRTKKEARQSRSRNSTPSSVLSAPSSVTGLGTTPYLDVPIASLTIPTHLRYDDLLEQFASTTAIPDNRHLDHLKDQLKTLSDVAEARELACDGAMRELSGRRKLRLEEEREMEANARLREAAEAAAAVAADDQPSTAGTKRSAMDDDDDDLDDDADRLPRASKIKKRKDHSHARDERPLTHGAHGLARQDGTEGTPRSKPPASPHHKLKTSTASGSSSSLSPPSQIQSPAAVIPKIEPISRPPPPSSSSSSDGARQPPPAPSIPQYQTFGPNPLTFDDPTIYHVREVLPEMSDDEKKDIYQVVCFPHDDLYHLIAGLPPDKDFSNAKPANQVNANTFATYLEPYHRPLTEEDMVFLKERGDRVTPFIMPRRGKPYAQTWADEDGVANPDSRKEQRPLNQPRGNVEQVDDDAGETDQISAGPMLNRLLATMRFEHRPEEGEKPNGVDAAASINGFTNGDLGADNIGTDGINGTSHTDARPPATYFPESAQPAWKPVLARPDYAAVDERLKAELRHLGFLAPDAEPDYDAHYDDEVAQRLRLLQSELRGVMLLNAARRARLYDLALEHLGWQEYATIRDDLDNQVTQAFSKRNRNLSKNKKQVKRPGGAGGGSHVVPSAAIVNGVSNGTGTNSSAVHGNGTAAPGTSGAAAGNGGGGGGGGGGAVNPPASAGLSVSKPGIGDLARTVMDRRRRWVETIAPVFSEDVTAVKTAGQSIFTDADLAPYLQVEKEHIEEEQEA